MKILVSGCSGLVGTAFKQRAESEGHEVYALTRRPRGERDISWSVDQGEIDAAALEGFDAVVHLAGDNIASGRWTHDKKRRIRESRVAGTDLLCRTLAALNQKPRVLVSASAIGYYGNRGDELLTESSSRGDLFLSDVCRDWEAATKAAEAAEIRVVHTRFGIILSPDGGALAKMLTPFRLGGGGIIGNGRQYWSWVSLADTVKAALFAIQQESLRGAVNVVAPNSVTNAEFTKVLGRVLSRPTVLPLPAFAARLVLGEMADELLLASARVAPQSLSQADYHFEHSELEPCLRELLGKPA